MAFVADQIVMTRAELILLKRARFLPDRDAALVRSFLERQLPGRQVARMLGIHPGTLSRRIQRLLRRLADPSNGFLMDHGDFLPPELRQVGIERLVQGMTIAQIADLHQLTPYQIRAMLTELRGCMRARAMRT